MLRTSQVSKQQRLNALHAVVSLRKDQLPLSGSTEMSDDAYSHPDDPLLVFSKNKWTDLLKRIEGLKEERTLQKQNFK